MLVTSTKSLSAVWISRGAGALWPTPYRAVRIVKRLTGRMVVIAGRRAGAIAGDRRVTLKGGALAARLSCGRWVGRVGAQKTAENISFVAPILVDSGADFFFSLFFQGAIIGEKKVREI